jgi:hypothetical protein
VEFLACFDVSFFFSVDKRLSSFWNVVVVLALFLTKYTLRAFAKKSLSLPILVLLKKQKDKANTKTSSSRA